MPRLLVPLIAAVLVLGVGACGGDDDSDTSSVNNQAQAKAEAKVPTPETPEEEEAKQRVQGFYDVLSEDEDPNRATIDSRAFCDLMASEARERLIEHAKRSSGLARQWDCESAVELLVLRAKRQGDFKLAAGAEVIGVDAEGDQATATIRFGDGATTSMPMVKEDGQWKLGASAVDGS